MQHGKCNSEGFKTSRRESKGVNDREESPQIDLWTARSRESENLLDHFHFLFNITDVEHSKYMWSVYACVCAWKEERRV